jgi:hypothetical protein
VNGTCKVWTDGTTFGISCTGLSGWYYHAEAMCNNGDVAAGPTYSGTSGTKSYAYCSTYDSTIDYAYPEWSSPNCGNGCILRKQGNLIFTDSRLNDIRHPARTMAPRPETTVNGTCNVWSDGTTFGIGCTGLTGWDYDGNANCASGNTAYGPGESGTSGTKSYAYCSTYSSYILSTWADIYR